MTTTQKIKHFIFIEGEHNICSVTSLAFYLALKNRFFDDVREMITEKYEKDITEQIAEIHEEKIAEFYVSNNRTILLRYFSNAQLYLKVMQHLFDEFIMLFECSFDREKTIDDNMKRIVFSKSLCENSNVKIY